MFKTNKVKERSVYLNPFASYLILKMHLYCLNAELPFMVTDTVSTIEEDKRIGRKHSTHREGRAFDLSVKGWDADQILDFCNHFNEEYKEEAAISSKTLKPTLCVYHVGTAPHIHVQLARKYGIDMVLPLKLQ